MMKKRDVIIKVALALGKAGQRKQYELDAGVTIKAALDDYEYITCGDNSEYSLRLTDPLRVELKVDRYSTPLIIAEFNQQMQPCVLVNELAEAIMVYENAYFDKGS